jgi:ABC-2 type transport system ATP-binding protein
MNTIKTHCLSFKYKDTSILDNLELEVPQGSIYGYLGKNGSGKTTTIKLLLGLLNSKKDSIFIDGKELNTNRDKILNHIGNLIETPCFYPNLTVFENLQYLDTIFRLGKDRINEVLSLVNLQDAGNKRSTKLSTGMKQRLGIAMAIYHHPNILILDEPLNGLDPEGIHDMRQLLLDLNQQGTTIFLSSHIISELEKTCSHIGILNEGRLVYQGLLSQLISGIKREIQIKISNSIQAAEICKSLQIEIIEQSENRLKIQVDNDTSHNELIKALVHANIDIYAVETTSCDLESVFLSIISR